MSRRILLLVQEDILQEQLFLVASSGIDQVFGLVEPCPVLSFRVDNCSVDSFPLCFTFVSFHMPPTCKVSG